MRRIGSILLSVAAVAGVVASQCLAADILDTKVTHFKSEPGRAFGLCDHLKVPCGYFIAEGDYASKPDTSRKKVELAQGTVRDALDALVQSNSDYKWSEQDGVINIEPKQERKHLEKGTDPLDTAIKEVDISGVTTDRGAQMILQASGLPVGGRVQAGGRWHYATVSLSLKNVTLRKALNELVKADGMAVWGLEYNPKYKNYVVDIYPWRSGHSLFGESGAQKKK